MPGKMAVALVLIVIMTGSTVGYFALIHNSSVIDEATRELGRCGNADGGYRAVGRYYYDVEFRPGDTKPFSIIVPLLIQNDGKSTISEVMKDLTTVGNVSGTDFIENEFGTGLRINGTGDVRVFSEGNVRLEVPVFLSMRSPVAATGYDDLRPNCNGDCGYMVHSNVTIEPSSDYLSIRAECDRYEWDGEQLLSGREYDATVNGSTILDFVGDQDAPLDGTVSEGTGWYTFSGRAGLLLYL